MPDTYINLSNLSKFKSLVDTYVGNAVSTGVASSIKSGVVYNDTVYFFTSATIPSSTSEYSTKAVFTIDLTSTEVAALQAALTGFSAQNTVADAITGAITTAEGYTDTAIGNLGTAAAKDVKTSDITGNDQSTDLVTAAQVSSFVASVIADINSFEYLEAAELPTASADTMYKIYLIPNTGSGTNVKDEYITIRSGSTGSYTYSWELFGSTEINLSNYVQKTQTIAGIALSGNISKADLLTAINVADGANVNVIDAIDTNDFVIGSSNILQVKSTKTLLTQLQATKLDSIAVDASNGSVTDGTNTLNNIVSDSSYAHISVSASGVSDGTNTFQPQFATDAQIEALFS